MQSIEITSLLKNELAKKYFETIGRLPNKRVLQGSDYIRLSKMISDDLLRDREGVEAILYQTSISSATLKRIFTDAYYVHDKMDIRKLRVLSTLSLYLGYKDWDDFVTTNTLGSLRYALTSSKMVEVPVVSDSSYYLELISLVREAIRSELEYYNVKDDQDVIGRNNFFIVKKIFTGEALDNIIHYRKQLNNASATIRTSVYEKKSRTKIFPTYNMQVLDKCILVSEVRIMHLYRFGILMGESITEITREVHFSVESDSAHKISRYSKLEADVLHCSNSDKLLIEFP